MFFFSDLFGLEEVFLSDNLLLSFSDEWFSNTPNVRIIHLQHNALVEIEENAMQPLKRSGMYRVFLFEGLALEI